MLFMIVSNFEPGKSEEMDKEISKMPRGKMEQNNAGLKTIGHWISVTGAQAFRVIETDDTRAIFIASEPLRKFAKVEVIPLLPPQEWERQQ